MTTQEILQGVHDWTNGKIVYDISEHNPTGGPNSDGKFTLEYILSNANTLIPSTVRKGGMSIKFVHTSDNKYVQYRLMPDEWSTDADDWAIADEGVYVEDTEFIYVKTDAEGKVLWAIKTDGSIYYGAGIPQQVKDYIEEKISSLSLDEYEDVVAFLSDYLGSDTTLKVTIDGINAQIANKLDAEGLNPEALETLQAVENQEYIQVTTDSEDKILEGITSEGVKQINLPIDTPSATIEHVDDFEWIDVKTEGSGNILEGIKKDGKRFLAFPTNQDDKIQEQVDAIKNKLASTPEFITVQDFNQLRKDKSNLPPYYLFTNNILINKGHVIKNLVGRNYYAKIGLFGDVHADYGYLGQVVLDPPVDERFGMAVAHLNDKGIDFGFDIGDNITTEAYPESQEGIKFFYTQLNKANYPFFSITGNHDVQLHDFIRTGIIEINNVRIVCFDAIIGTTTDPNAGHKSRGDVTDETMEWLTNAVRDSYEKGFIIILACHYPLAYAGIPYATFEESIRRHRDDIINLCQQYEVKLYIGGHEHGPNLEYMIVSNDDITLDMTNVQLGLSYIAFSTLTIDETGFHFISFDSITGEQLHTLFIPFENQASGTIYE